MATKDKNAGADLAKIVASTWGDDVLEAKAPRDLLVAYGVDERKAKEILRLERFRRGMSYE